MLLNLTEWAQLEPGMYLYRFGPRLMIVQVELGLPDWLTCTWTRADWAAIVPLIHYHAITSHEEVVAAGVSVIDCEMIERCDYVV